MVLELEGESWTCLFVVDDTVILELFPSSGKVLLKGKSHHTHVATIFLPFFAIIDPHVFSDHTWILTWRVPRARGLLQWLVEEC